jgi:hypothetical protein
MDLMLRDSNFRKKEVIKKPSFSCSSGLYGASKNDFELVLTEDDLLPIGDLITYGTSEYGGAILNRITDTKERTVKYIGKTFRGQMENSVISPFAILSLTGTDFELLSSLVNLSQLNYKVLPTGNTEQKTIVLPIGTNLLKASDLVMNAFNEKMVFKVSNNGVEITILPITEKTYDASQVGLVADENKLIPTALHAKGKDYSVSVYVQSDGTIGDERYYTGFNAVEIWQELNDNVENSNQLFSIAADKLLALRKTENASEVDVVIENADIGDKINVTVQRFGIKTTQTVCEKILKIEGKNAIETFNTGG